MQRYQIVRKNTLKTHITLVKKQGVKRKTVRTPCETVCLKLSQDVLLPFPSPVSFFTALADQQMAHADISFQCTVPLWCLGWGIRGGAGGWGSILQEDNVYVSQRKTLKVLDGALNSFAGVFLQIQLKWLKNELLLVENSLLFFFLDSGFSA